VLDLQRFCDKREDKADQERLIAELTSYGLEPCAEAIELESEGYYRLFESKRAGDGRGFAVEVTKPEVEVGAAQDAESAAASTQQQSTQLSVVGRTDLASRQLTDLTVQESAGEMHTPLGRVRLPPMPQPAARSRFGGWLGLSALLVIGLPSLLAVIYYGFLASSQYVTNFQFAVRGPSQAAGGRSAAGALMGPTAMSPDAFVVTDYINSAQAIADVERGIDLRAVFSRSDIDFLSRLPSGLTSEELNAYWKRMVWAHFDLISGNVSVSVRAFTPQESLKLAQTLVTASDEMFRKLNTKAQQDFVRAADENVERAREQLTKARQALFVFREEGGLVDADKSATAGAAIIDDLRKQLAALQTQFASVKASAPNSPMLQGLSGQIAALEAQITRGDTSGSSKVKSVSAETLAEYQSLELERQFADKHYTEALALKNQAYLVAQNQQSYLALFVAPTLPQTSLYPDRPKSIMAVILAAAAAWFAGMLITYALRDHLM
jgi:capsular polysaccharide transport system permease protein